MINIARRKNLADLTPDQRVTTLGMWCLCGNKPHPAILFNISNNSGHLIDPRDKTKYRLPFEDITPLFDIPRAWNPDGTPILRH